MRTLRIVATSPSFRLDPGFQHAVEELAVKTVSTEDRVEALPVCILPGTPRIDVMRLYPLLHQPFRQLHGNELGPVVHTEQAATGCVTLIHAEQAASELPQGIRIPD